MGIVDGYPRSGNTFAAEVCQFVLKRCYDKSFQEAFIHHFHEDIIADIALAYRLPSLFLIRDPREAIVSCCLYRLSEEGLTNDSSGLAEAAQGSVLACKYLIEKESLKYRLLYSKLDAYWSHIGDVSSLLFFESFSNNPLLIVESLIKCLNLSRARLDGDLKLIELLSTPEYFLRLISSNALKLKKPLHQVSAPRHAGNVELKTSLKKIANEVPAYLQSVELYDDLKGAYHLT